MSMSSTFYDGGYECKYCHLIGHGKMPPHKCMRKDGIQYFRTYEGKLVSEGKCVE